MALPYRKFALALVAGGTLAGPPSVAEEKKLGWTDSAEVGFVATDGNAKSSSLGFKNVAARNWEHAVLTLRASAVRVESEQGAAIAMALPGGGFKVIEPDSEVTTENFAASGRFDRNITDRFFWFSGAGWDRNEPAGIQDRYVAEGGVGNVWHDTDELMFKTNYGLTVTKQVDVVETAGADETFAGARGAWAYRNKLTATTTYTNDLVLDANVEESSRWRADMQNGLAVAMSQRIALKVGLRFLYENQPASEALRLLDESGVDTGTTVLVELDKLDTVLTASLVVNYP